jgi:FixJ family two-component response regulator
VQPAELLDCIARALQHVAGPAARLSSSSALRLAGLTQREREVVDHVVDGKSSREIATLLGIAQRTVETHWASAMRKTGAASPSALVRLVLNVRGGSG